VLPGILVKDDGGGYADVQALGPAVLWNGQPPDFRIKVRFETDAVFLMAEDKGAFFGQVGLHDRFPLSRFQDKGGVSPVQELGIAGFRWSNTRIQLWIPGWASLFLFRWRRNRRWAASRSAFIISLILWGPMLILV